MLCSEDDGEFVEFSEWGFKLSDGGEEGGGAECAWDYDPSAKPRVLDEFVWCRNLSERNEEAAMSLVTWGAHACMPAACHHVDTLLRSCMCKRLTAQVCAGNDEYNHEWMYTFAAIIVEVPDLASRLKLVHGG
jgi:hypothetical protein